MTPTPDRRGPGAAKPSPRTASGVGRPDGAAVMAGAEPFSAPGGPHGALVLHGFTGNPHSVRGLAQALAGAGFAVECPRLPGHGTALADMQLTGWADWSEAVEAAYTELASRVDKVVIAGLSMGGTLTCWLASRHPDVAGIACVNPLIDPPAQSFLEMMQAGLEAGVDVVPGIGSDIAKPGIVEITYDGTPVAPALSLMEAVTELRSCLSDIRCPLLLLTSFQDHVVPPISSDVLAAEVAGPVERVTLERSYHVATLDWDKDEVEARIVEFAKKVTAGAAKPSPRTASGVGRPDGAG